MWKQIEWTGGGAHRDGRDSQIPGRGREAAVAEQELDRAYVCPPFKEMDRKGMPQRMRCDRLGDAAKSMSFLACFFDRARGDVSAQDAAWKQPLPGFFHLPPVPENLKQPS